MLFNINIGKHNVKCYKDSILVAVYHRLCLYIVIIALTSYFKHHLHSDLIKD